MISFAYACRPFVAMGPGQELRSVCWPGRALGLLRLVPWTCTESSKDDRIVQCTPMWLSSVPVYGSWALTRLGILGPVSASRYGTSRRRIWHGLSSMLVFPDLNCIEGRQIQPTDQSVVVNKMKESGSRARVMRKQQNKGSVCRKGGALSDDMALWLTWIFHSLFPC